MKKIMTRWALGALFTLMVCSAMAQVPQAINYQAVARNNAGALLPNQTISIKINILSGSATGPVLYSERHVIQTNQFGLFSLPVGRGTPVSGQFPTISWRTSDQWLQVELDPTGGTNYFLMGTSELLSVPFALYAEEAGSVIMGMPDLIDVDTTGLQQGYVLKWDGTNWVPAPDNNSGQAYTAGTTLSLTSGNVFNHDPHTGDAIGDDTLTVVGIQTVPVTSVYPTHLQILKFDGFTNTWILDYDSSSHPYFGGTGITVSNDTIYHAPHWGDAVGADSLTVTGLQGVPISTTLPLPDEVLKFNATTGEWEPRPDSSSIPLVGGNGIAISGDTIINTIWIEDYPDIYRDTGNVGIGTPNPHPAAILELDANDRGFLPPRLTADERDSIPGPPMGLTIFNTTDSLLNYYNGSCWMTTYQRSCDDCDFDMWVTDTTGIIDHVNTDSASTTIVINQTSTGGIFDVGLYVLPFTLPPGMTVSLGQNLVNGSGTSRLSVKTTVFTTPGTYPVIVQGFCGSALRSAMFLVTVDSCYTVDIFNARQDFDLANFGSLPGPGTPICVVANLSPGVEITSTDTLTPAFDVGNLDTGSVVGINNWGVIMGTGGDGGAGGSFSNFGEPGYGGGDALNLSCTTYIQNQGQIYGGGGGGGSVGLELFNLPIIGSFSVGAGGGGGARDGQGGGTGLIVLLWQDGQDGTSGIYGFGGQGGNLNIPISFSITGLEQITITPQAQGGDGGGYGIDGTTGTLYVNVAISLPFVGTIFNQNFPNPPISVFPGGGEAGMAIKRNGHPLSGYVDGNYQNFQIKGEVGN